MLLSTLTNTNTTHSFCLMHYKKKKNSSKYSCIWWFDDCEVKHLLLTTLFDSITGFKLRQRAQVQYGQSEIYNILHVSDIVSPPASSFIGTFSCNHTSLKASAGLTISTGGESTFKDVWLSCSFVGLWTFSLASSKWANFFKTRSSLMHT